MVLGLNFTHSRFFVDQCKKAFDGEYMLLTLTAAALHNLKIPADYMCADVDVDKDGSLDLKELYLVGGLPQTMGPFLVLFA